MSTLQIEKAELRKEIKASLKNISHEVHAHEIHAKSLLIREHLLQLDVFRHALQSERLMIYVSMPLEVNTLPFIGTHSMIVPYCEDKEIIPIRIKSLNELEPSGSMNILEPTLTIRHDPSRQVLLEEISVVLVPGLAFDCSGNRLGRGKGFYDRFLHRLPKNVLTLGLAFNEMIRKRIPYGESDEPVDRIITESGIVYE